MGPPCDNPLSNKLSKSDQPLRNNPCTLLFRYKNSIQNMNNPILINAKIFSSCAILRWRLVISDFGLRHLKKQT